MIKKSNRLFDIRKSLGLTQDELAKRLGVAKNYIYLMEAGRKPLTDTVLEHAEKLYSLSNSGEIAVSPASGVSDLITENRALKERIDRAERREAELLEIISNLSKSIAPDRTGQGHSPASPPVHGAAGGGIKKLDQRVS